MSAAASVVSDVARLRQALATHATALSPIDHRLIRGCHGHSGEMYQWYLEVGGYKPEGLEDEPKAFNTYELHPVISAGDEGLVFTLHLEHNVYEVGVEDQHEFQHLNPDTLAEFQAVAKSWDIPADDVQNGVSIIKQLVDSICPVLADLDLDREHESALELQPA
jgi:hypothetical protein